MPKRVMSWNDALYTFRTAPAVGKARTCPREHRGPRLALSADSPFETVSRDRVLLRAADPDAWFATSAGRRRA